MYTTISRVVLASTFFMLSSLSLEATQIIWQSTRAAHETGAGQALDDSYIFELGIFTETFVPTEFNVSEWATNWQLADRTVYDPASRAFTSRHEVDSNAAPFFKGERGYVWGYSTTSTEWFLMTAPNWVWPDANRIGFPIEWTTLTATKIVVGSVSNIEGQVHLVTEAVGNQPVPVLTRSSWQEMVFTESERADPNISAWNADPDHDGHDNLLEYALGGDPLSFNQQLGITTTIGQPGLLKVQLTRLPNRLATPFIELSTDLVQWDGLGNLAEEDSLTRESITLQWQSIQRQFIRVGVSL